MKKLFIGLMILLGCIVVSNAAINASSLEKEGIELINGAKSGVLIEETTGQILYQKNANKRLAPASMTKIMTLLLIYEAMDNNLISKDTMLIADEYSCSMGGSQVYLKVGEQISVDEALKCVCIASANDCAVLFAVQIAGSEAAFVNKMNEKAKSLGLKNTNFMDCTGLSSKDHYSSAYDMAIMAKELVTKHPNVLEYTSLKEDYIRKDTNSPFWLVNTNKLVGRVEGLSGLKTGFTSFSGYCITLHMKQSDMGLISVVFGYDKPTNRNAESLELLRYGFSNYKIDTIFKKGDKLESLKHILYKDQLGIIVNEDIKYLCKKTDNNTYTSDYKYEMKNSSCEGSINVYSNNELIGSYGVSTDKEVKRKNFFELVGSIINNIFLK